jgi:uncharacterized protein (DUF58 family)
MFFGSEMYFKSVIAAETAALSAWKVLAVGDRIGGLVFNDTEFDEINPHRSRKNVLRLLNMIVEKNNKLSINSFQSANQNVLNDILARAQKMVTTNFLVVIFSDFSGFNNNTIKSIISLSQHNDVIPVKISDVFENQLTGAMNIGEGQEQVDLSEIKSDIKEKYNRKILHENKIFHESLKRYNIPLLEMNTIDSPLSQIRNLIGRRR